MVTVQSARSPDVPPHKVHLFAPASGFLVWIDESALLAAALEADAVPAISRQPGNFLVEGVPVGACWSIARTLFDADTLHHLSDQAAAAIHTGPERTAAQDSAFGLRQLTDVTARALSPGVNDPTTAIHALGHTSALLVEIVNRDLGPRFINDDDGSITVIVRRPGFADLMELAIRAPRRYGAADPFVLGRLYGLRREIAWIVTLPEQSSIVTAQLLRLDATTSGRIRMVRGANGARRSSSRYPCAGARFGTSLQDPLGIAIRRVLVRDG